jgi:uncharacterized protein (DUF736 family)
MEYKEEDTFVLFKNDKKADNHPDYTGKLTWSDGTKKDIAVWIKTAKSGKKFMSGVINEPYVPNSAPSNAGSDLDNSEIPF